MSDCDIGDACGEITVDWMKSSLSDFMLELRDDDADEFVVKVNHLSRVYRLTGDDMVNAIVAFVTNQKRTDIDLSLLDLFEQNYLKKNAANRKASVAGYEKASSLRSVLGELTPSSAHDAAFNDSSLSVPSDDEQITLPSKYLTLTPLKCAVSSETYQKRRDPGRVQSEYVGKLFIAEIAGGRRGENDAKVRIEVVAPLNLARIMRFGNEKHVEQFEEISSRIQSLTNVLQDVHEEIADCVPFDIRSSSVICGQILDENEDRLEVGTCSLQTLDDNYGTIHLDLTNMSPFSLFPGKVVAVKGENRDGSSFMVNSIYELPSLPMASVIPQPDINLLRIWCAAGPFSSGKSFSYEPLYDLLELARKERPHVLILMGPFIDRTSEAARSPKLLIAFEKLLESLMVNISEMMHCSDVEVVIVPNGKKDATSFPCYPTAAFALSTDVSRSLDKNMIFAPDPTILRIGGIQVALSTSEIMQHLAREEIHRSENSENEERMTRLFSHLLKERSLYPLYPPPSGMSYSSAAMIQATALESTPQLMILPCVLGPMCKISEGCMCVNPNFLVRGESGGSFAKIDIDLSLLCAEPGKLITNCSIADCARVQIVRI